MFTSNSSRPEINAGKELLCLKEAEEFIKNNEGCSLEQVWSHIDQKFGLDEFDWGNIGQPTYQLIEDMVSSQKEDSPREDN